MRGRMFGEAYLDLDVTLCFGLGEPHDQREVGKDESGDRRPSPLVSHPLANMQWGSKLVSLTTLISGLVNTEMFSDGKEEEWVGTL